jgi:hypothetical protein
VPARAAELTIGSLRLVAKRAGVWSNEIVVHVAPDPGVVRGIEISIETMLRNAEHAQGLGVPPEVISAFSSEWMGTFEATATAAFVMTVTRADEAERYSGAPGRAFRLEESELLQSAEWIGPDRPADGTYHLSGGADPVVAPTPHTRGHNPEESAAIRERKKIEAELRAATAAANAWLVGVEAAA